jgi:alkanesulfonate monooxygenase SsuD/methylene tetrahydromethanopterin reductase-like flavin-dependent oxidoreductase (luciferase family)
MASTASGSLTISSIASLVSRPGVFGSAGPCWRRWLATQRVEIGTLVLCNSFRNPAILAKMATTADEVRDRRLILGVGAGWNEPEYQAFGLPFDHRVDRFEEALQILKPLLREGHVDFAGQYYRARKLRHRAARPAVRRTAVDGGNSTSCFNASPTPPKRASG